MKLLQSAADKAHSPSFEIPCATLRWGSAKGMGRKLAVEVATDLVGL